MIAEIRDKEGERKKECKEGGRERPQYLLVPESKWETELWPSGQVFCVCVIEREREKDVFVVFKKVFIQVCVQAFCTYSDLTGHNVRPK